MWIRISWTMAVFKLFCVFCICSTWTVSALTTTVQAPCGRLKGMEKVAPNKKTYLAFYNIPYAKPPVGDLRFADPVPFEKMDEEFDATKDEKIMCLQHFPAVGEIKQPFNMGREDCLILNVFVPKLDSTKRKVLVFIHGGGYVNGYSGMHEPGAFVTEQGIIVVTINYRLGLLGFLSTENEASSGNFGLWDQVLALKWVKENIAAFGGEADDVTIVGDSAGAASVGALSISPSSKELFTKAYPQSGTASATFSNVVDAQKYAIEVARAVGCMAANEPEKLNKDQSRDIIACLRKRPFSDFLKYSNFQLGAPHFAPRVDGHFFPRPVLELLKDETYLESVGFYDRKYLIGVNNNEVGFISETLKNHKSHYLNAFLEAERQQRADEFLQSIDNDNVGSRLLPLSIPMVKQKVLEWYGKRYVNVTAQIVSDLYFLIPTYDFLHALGKKGDNKAWLLYFNHFPSFMKGGYRGIFHGMDLAYWLDLTPADMNAFLLCGVQGDMDENELAVKMAFSGLLGQFVKTGELTNAVDVHDLQGPWPAYDIQGSHYLEFSDQPKVRRHWEMEKEDLWFNKVPAWVEQSQRSSEEQSQKSYEGHGRQEL